LYCNCLAVLYPYIMSSCSEFMYIQLCFKHFLRLSSCMYCIHVSTAVYYAVSMHLQLSSCPVPMYLQLSIWSVSIYLQLFSFVSRYLQLSGLCCISC
jgi:hypothetical protein